MDTELLAAVETRMRAALDESSAGNNVVIKAALDHLNAGGGRIRARLSLDASARLGLDVLDSIALASICELIHNASLIHDDLLDRAAFRRGLPSVWATFGDATAVCAGDLLLASAFAVLADLRATQLIGPGLSLLYRRTREVILSQGTEQNCKADSLESYETVAVAKSSSLLSLPLELSLLVSGNQDSMPRAQGAAIAFATAYQMMDDVEDYAEDQRYGALNVVTVSLRSGSSTYQAACVQVLHRVEALLRVSIEEAQALPMDCGSQMIDYAQTMLTKLASHPDFAMEIIGSAHDAR